MFNWIAIVLIKDGWEWPTTLLYSIDNVSYDEARSRVASKVEGFSGLKSTDTKIEISLTKRDEILSI